MNSFESTRDFYEGPGGFLGQLGLLIMIFMSYSLLKRVKDNSDRTRALFCNSKIELSYKRKIRAVALRKTSTRYCLFSKKSYNLVWNLLKATAHFVLYFRLFYMFTRFSFCLFCILLNCILLILHFYLFCIFTCFLFLRTL